MEIDPTPQPSIIPSSTQRRPSRFWLMLGIASLAFVLLCLIVGTSLTSFFGGTSPKVSGVTTAHGLVQGALVDEKQVFDIGEDVHIAYTISGGRNGYTLAAHVMVGDKVVNAPELTHPLHDGEKGLGSLIFVPKAEGVYRASLLLNGAPVPDAQVMFKVVAGGSRLQEVTTSKKVDERTYKALDQTMVFGKRDTINIAYRAVKAQPGDKLAVVYYVDGKRQPEDARDHDSFAEGGTFRGFFSITGAEQALQVGSYRAELFYNNDLVAVRTFEVK